MMDWSEREHSEEWPIVETLPEERTQLFGADR